MLKKEKVRLQHTLRIYTQEDRELLDKAYEENQKKFDSQSDFIRYCVVLGAKKLLGDNALDEVMNLTEIKECLTGIQRQLKYLDGERRADNHEQHLENELVEKLLNYIANAVFNNEGNKSVGDEIEEGLFNIPYEKLTIMHNEDKEKNGR